MSIAPDLDNLEPISETIVFPPSDLLSDEPPLESELHLRRQYSGNEQMPSATLRERVIRGIGLRR